MDNDKIVYFLLGAFVGGLAWNMWTQKQMSKKLGEATKKGQDYAYDLAISDFKKLLAYGANAGWPLQEYYRQLDQAA